MHWAEQYIGTPYLSGGDSLEAGLDCWGLFRLIQRKHYDIDLPAIPLTKYTFQKAAKEFKNNAELSNWYDIDAGKQQDGDAVVMRVGVRPSHVGVWIDDGEGVTGVLHSLEGIGAIFSGLDVLNQGGWKVASYHRHISK